MHSENLYTDEALLQRITRGDSSAFTALYTRHWEELFMRAAKLIRNKEDAADIVQDIFLSLWRRREIIQVHGPVAAYLYTSVRYQTIHYIEKNITRAEYQDMLESLAGQFESASDSTLVTPETQLQAKELSETIQAAIKSMPPKMKEVYLLSRQEQMTHRQIAEKLNISEETVKKHIQHALALIKNQIGKSSFSFASILVSLFF